MFHWWNSSHARRWKIARKIGFVLLFYRGIQSWQYFGLEQEGKNQTCSNSTGNKIGSTMLAKKEGLYFHSSSFHFEAFDRRKVKLGTFLEVRFLSHKLLCFWKDCASDLQKTRISLGKNILVNSPAAGPFPPKVELHWMLDNLCHFQYKLLDFKFNSLFVKKTYFEKREICLLSGKWFVKLHDGPHHGCPRI